MPKWEWPRQRQIMVVPGKQNGTGGPPEGRGRGGNGGQGDSGKSPSGGIQVLANKSTNQQTSGGGASFSWSHTVVGGTTALFVVFAVRQAKAVSTVTYGGVGMTACGAHGQDTLRSLDIYYLLNPTPGTANVVVTYSTTVTSGRCFTATGVNLSKVNQSTPIGTAATAQSSTGLESSVTVTSAVGEFVLDGTAWNGSPGQPLVCEQNLLDFEDYHPSDSIRYGSSWAAGAASVSSKWSTAAIGGGWLSVAVPIKPAP